MVICFLGSLCRCSSVRILLYKETECDEISEIIRPKNIKFIIRYYSHLSSLNHRIPRYYVEIRRTFSCFRWEHEPNDSILEFRSQNRHQKQSETAIVRHCPTLWTKILTWSLVWWEWIRRAWRCASRRGSCGPCASSGGVLRGPPRGTCTPCSPGRQSRCRSSGGTRCPAACGCRRRPSCVHWPRYRWCLLRARALFSCRARPAGRTLRGMRYNSSSCDTGCRRRARAVYRCNSRASSAPPECSLYSLWALGTPYSRTPPPGSTGRKQRAPNARHQSV